jgi:hypothetical protein
MTRKAKSVKEKPIKEIVLDNSMFSLFLPLFFLRVEVEEGCLENSILIVLVSSSITYVFKENNERSIFQE